MLRFFLPAKLCSRLLLVVLLALVLFAVELGKNQSTPISHFNALVNEMVPIMLK